MSSVSSARDHADDTWKGEDVTKADLLDGSACAVAETTAADRRMRWPSASTIRAAAAALASGESLALASRKLRYVSAFFGLSLPPRPADLTARQWAARQNWIRRREVFGETGFSKEGELALKLNLVQAAIVKQRKPKSRQCRRGHRWTAANTRMTARGRSCRACEQIMRGLRRYQRTVERQAAERLAELRRDMIAIGIKAQRNPSSAYWRDRYVAIRERWLDLKNSARVESVA
jgi:hypothetical protein